MNAEQASKRVMQEPTRLRYGEGRRCWGRRTTRAPNGPAGVVAMACMHKGERRNTGSPVGRPGGVPGEPAVVRVIAAPVHSFSSTSPPDHLLLTRSERIVDFKSAFAISSFQSPHLTDSRLRPRICPTCRLLRKAAWCWLCRTRPECSTHCHVRLRSPCHYQACLDSSGTGGGAAPSLHESVRYDG